jgi:hypothetical protein
MEITIDFISIESRIWHEIPEEFSAYWIEYLRHAAAQLKVWKGKKWNYDFGISLSEFLPQDAIPRSDYPVLFWRTMTPEMIRSTMIFILDIEVLPKPSPLVALSEQMVLGFRKYFKRNFKSIDDAKLDAAFGAVDWAFIASLTLPPSPHVGLTDPVGG